MRPIAGTITEVRRRRPVHGEGEVAWRRYAHELEGTIEDRFVQVQRMLRAQADYISKVDHRVGLLANHVDQTDAEILAEVNRVADTVGETAERTTLKVLADELAAKRQDSARARAYRVDV